MRPARMSAGRRLGVCWESPVRSGPPAGPEIVRTQAELALEAARRPELMDVFDPWRQGLVRVVEELVRCAGRDDPALRAAVGVAAIEGVLASAIRMPTARRSAFVRAAVPLVVRGLHVTG